jgi:hypothetical protein
MKQSNTQNLNSTPLTDSGLTLNKDERTKVQAQESLSFLHIILNFQAALADKIESGFHLEPAVAREKWNLGQPLLAGESLSMPVSLFQEALTKLQPLLPPGSVAHRTTEALVVSGQLAGCSLQLGDFELRMSEFVAKNQKSVPSTSQGGQLQAEESKTQDLDSYIEQMAGATSTTPDIIDFLLRTVLSPFFEKQARPYQELIAAANWRRGICPICGFEPGMARLARQSGRRFLACSLCHTEWAFDRLRCPFCESDGQPGLSHFTTDDDEAHRVDCCNRCRRYIKTIDERVLGSRANLPEEDALTFGLDELARKYGYR